MILGYIDPASGSMFLQIILGGAAAVAVALKMWWRPLPPLPAHPQGRRRRSTPAEPVSAAHESESLDPVREPAGKAEPLPRAAHSLEPGSFRDWDSRVFYDDGRVLRALSEDGLADWHALAGSKLFAGAVAEGKLVATSRRRARRSTARPPSSSTSAFPFVSYPYEWTFAMLRDAALLQLELLRRALDEDLMLKDASSYNVQWRGAQPGLHRRRLVRAAARGRAVGGLPAVLHALPQPAAAAGVQGRRLPAVAARQPRRDHAGRGAAAAVVPRSLPPRRADERRVARAARAQARRVVSATSRPSCKARASRRS